jgi:hypothetical protein
MSDSLNFLLQATKVLHNRNYDANELNLVYDYISTIDNKTLNEYFNSGTILTYKNDLELYVEIVNSMMSIFEEKEEYEKCLELKKKKEESLKIKKENKKK